MREPEISGDVVDWGMVYYRHSHGDIKFADGEVAYEPHEWDELLAQLKAAIRYARRMTA